MRNCIQLSYFFYNKSSCFLTESHHRTLPYTIKANESVAALAALYCTPYVADRFKETSPPMPQSNREQKYLEQFKSFISEDKRTDYLYALKFLAALLRDGCPPLRRARQPRRVKRSG